MEQINDLRALLQAKENNLHDTNGLALAQLEGEEMEEYGDVIAYRHQLRLDIKSLKEQIAAAEEEEKPEEEKGQHPNWEDLIGHFLEFGLVVAHEGNLYQVIIPHTAQSDWTPIQSNLFKSYSEDEWPAWVQPVGASDAYPLEAKVSHVAKHWKSDVANNVWEPGVYGWSEIVG